MHFLTNDELGAIKATSALFKECIEGLLPNLSDDDKALVQRYFEKVKEVNDLAESGERTKTEADVVRDTALDLQLMMIDEMRIENEVLTKGLSNVINVIWDKKNICGPCSQKDDMAKQALMSAYVGSSGNEATNEKGL